MTDVLWGSYTLHFKITPAVSHIFNSLTVLLMQSIMIKASVNLKESFLSKLTQNLNQQCR